MAPTLKSARERVFPKLSQTAAALSVAGPASASTWDRFFSEVDGCQDRFTAKAKALTSAAPVVVAPPPPVPAPPPPAPPPPPPPVTYPTPAGSGVFMTRTLTEDTAEKARAEALGVADLYALRDTAGAPNTAKRRVEQGGLPAGISFDGGVIVNIRPPAGWNPAVPFEVADFDFTGLQVIQEGDGFEVAYRRCLMLSTAARPLAPLQVNVSGRSPNARTTLDQVTMSQEDPGASGKTVLRMPFGGVRILSTRFERIAGVVFNHDGPGPLEIDGAYFESPGQNPSPGSHIEPYQIVGGLANVRNCFHDGIGAFEPTPDKPWPAAAGVTCFLPFIQPRNSAATVTIERLLALPREFRSWSNIVAASNNFPLERLTISNTVQEMCKTPGTGEGRCGPIQWGGMVLKAGNNRRWDGSGLIDGLNGGL